MRLRFIRPVSIPEILGIDQDGREIHQIQAVDMHRENLDGDTLRRYPLINEEQIRVVN